MVNCSQEDFIKKKNKYLPAIKDHIENKLGGGTIILYSAEYEEMIQNDLIEPDGKEYPEGVINQIIQEGNKLLDLINFFTVGKDEVRAWTIRKGFKNP